jgi:hypothetical protein
LPFSPGGTNDDRRIESIDSFLGPALVLTEKMDGSNVCLEAKAVYARSHGSAPNHPSFDALKAMHAVVKNRIPESYQIFGEWLYAKHSIAYSALPGYLMVFGVRDLARCEGGEWVKWEEVELWADELGCPTVPVLWRGSGHYRDFEIKNLVEELAKQPSRCGGPREGVVVRVAHQFPDSLFSTSVAKWVRKDHVQTEDHWSHQQIVKNVVVP